MLVCGLTTAWPPTECRPPKGNFRTLHRRWLQGGVPPQHTVKLRPGVVYMQRPQYHHDRHIIHHCLFQDSLACLVWRRCARLHPSMHLRDHKVEALLRVCFIIEDELALHVVELEQFYSDSVAIRD